MITQKKKQDDKMSGTSIQYAAKSLSISSEPMDERIDEVSDTLLYRGWASVGSSDSSQTWRIARISTSGTVTSTKWADGDSNYDKVWNNRASYDYDY